MSRAILASVAAAAVALTAACGSTVQTSGQGLAGGGLTPQQQGLDASGVGAPGAADPLGLGSSSTAPGGGSTGIALGSGSGATTGGGPAGGAGGTGSAVGPGAVPGGAPGAGAQPAGPTGSRGKIQIGFVTTSVGNAQALGANPGNTYTDKQMFSALVAEYNKVGGVAGRQIVPVYGETDTASQNWESDFAAVCSQFTEDNKVRAVIGYIFIFLESFESCLAKAGVAHLYGGYQPGDVVAQGQYPNFVATGHPTVDGFVLAGLDGGLKSGLIKPTTTKLGLLLDTCANGARAQQRTIEPWLKAKKINYQIVQVDCASGSGDVSSAAASVSNAQLRFAASGVDVVSAFGIGLIVFMQQAESQGYRPTYVTTVAGKAIQDNAPREQVKKLHGFGWMPSVDVDAAHQPYPKTPAQQACLSKLAKRGLQPVAYNDFMAAYQACDGIELYAKALAAKGSDQASAVVQGVVEAIPSFRGAGTYEGALRANGRQRGGAATMREYAWTDQCTCLTYRGPTYPIPTP